MAVLVFGVVDLSRGYQLHIRAENAAREGAAFAQIYPNDVSCPTGGDVIDRVAGEEAELADHAGFRVEVHGQDHDGDWVPITGCGGDVATAGERVRVDVTVTFDVLTPVVERIVGSTMDLTGSAEVRVQG